MTRILHTADWQIGRQYGRFATDDAVVLAQARLQAVARIAELAIDQSVAAVLVAGDLFDAQTVSQRTLQQTFLAMAAYPGPWIIIPGNHDAALAESVWTRALRLNAVAANVHLLLAPTPTLFEAEGLAILPAPLTQRQVHDDLTEWFDDAQTPPGLLRIGLAHGSVTGQLPESADSPNPIAPNRAQTARLDYLALGDWHGLKRVDAHTWYSGTPEQERFKDNGAGCVLLVEIDRPGAVPSVQPIRIGQYTWVKRDFTLAVEADLPELLQALTELPSMSVVELCISGQASLVARHQLVQALNALEAHHRSLQYDLSALRLQPTEEDITALQADGYVGEVIEQLRRQQGDAEGTADPVMAATAREALIILADLLQQRQPQEDTR